jgi:acetate---CoA ligase (ADP-forming)
MRESPRPLYRYAQLRRVLAPASVAIVGASPRAGSFGERLQANLAGHYTGRVHLVNAKYTEIGGQPCYPNLLALPESPDCVVITVPREAAEPVVVEAAERRAGGVVLFASGYAETGKPERIAAQQRLSAIARESSMPVIGPNCLGFVNYGLKARLSFSDYPAPRPPRAAAVGIASQSGALSQSLAQAIEYGCAVSHAFSAGNQSDVDVADLVAYLVEDEACRAIACVFEGMSEPERLLEAADLAWRAGKPLLVHKIATGPLGAEAAISHTGSLAGSNTAYLAAFERAGMILIPDFEGLMEAAAFFAKAPPPKAPGVAVVATSGGAAIMAADKAERHGVPLPQPSPPVLEVLMKHVPDFGSPRNPCDVTAQVVNNPASLWACGEALMSDSAFGALVVPQPVAFDFHIPRIAAFSELSAKYDKITCNVLVSQWPQGPATREAEESSHVALFRSMERCFDTLAAWHRRHVRTGAGPRIVKRLAPPAAATIAAKLLDEAKERTLTEREAKQVLAAYGVPVVGEQLVSDAVDALAAANALGYPVALKVESPDILHKTDAGVIRLDLRNEADVRAGFAAIMARAQAIRPRARLNGVLVQPMVPPGLEIMVGARVDPQLGPLVVVGLGGVLVELLKDTAVELAPITPTEARAMLERLRGAALLKGFRGSQPVAIDALAEVICRLSELAADQRERLAELDVNPLICAGRRIVAVDALLARRA